MSLDVCQHGGLRRKCEICERDQELTLLRTRLAVATRALQYAHDFLSDEPGAQEVVARALKEIGP